MITAPMSAIIAVSFVWIGFVSAISFMEAWLKFRAQGITVSLGLGIGRLVFNALNKVEWVLATVIIISVMISKYSFFTFNNTFFFIPFFLLMLQTFWLLPALDARAELHIQGQTVPPSYLHFYYVGIELVKVICLAIFGITLLYT